MSRNNPNTTLVTTNVVRIILESSCQGQYFNMAWDFVSRTLITLTPTVLQALISAFDNATTLAALRASLSSSQTLQRYIAQDLNPATTPSVTSSIALVGTAAATTLPIFVSAILFKGTTFKGQHGRGRTYFGAIPTTFTDPATEPDLLNATGLGKYNDVNAATIAPLTAGGSTWDWSVTTRPVAPAYLVTRYAVVTTHGVAAYIGTTRRRKEGRGQ